MIARDAAPQRSLGQVVPPKLRRSHALNEPAIRGLMLQLDSDEERALAAAQINALPSMVSMGRA